MFEITCSFLRAGYQTLLHTDGSLNQNIRKKSYRAAEPVLKSLIHNPTPLRFGQFARKATLSEISKRIDLGIELDPFFAEPNDQVSYYIDADFLFFRPFAGLFKGGEVKDGAIFLKDDQWDAYCIRPWHLLGSNPKPNIVQGITTAIVFWDKMAIDWDYLEWFLGEAKYHKICDWIMPTAQAGLARRCKAKTVCSEQITNLYPNA